MSTAPVPASHALIERLATVAAASAFDEFELERLHRDATALLKADAAGAHTVLGAVAALRGDAGKAHRHHEIALNLDDSVACWLNYTSSLSGLGEHAEALRVTLDGLKRYPGQLDLLDRAIRAAVASADLLKAEELCDAYDAAPSDEPHPLAVIVDHLADATRGGAFGEPAVRELLDVVYSIEREAGLRASSWEIRCPGGATRSFLYERSLFASPASAAELNERLAERIAGHPSLMNDPGLEFVAVFTGAGDDGGWR